ncbi:uncharacterized protein [Temnothorax nylanderi]|uniref:uncharacterized protein n=1 Tax=Temnothorax nylanderi TaxID=102681 RepID=UPI003A85ADFE
MPLKFVKSNKGKNQLIADGELYYKHGEGSNGKVIWRCVQYKTGCRGICHTSSVLRDGIILHQTEHTTHAPNAAAVETKRVVAKLRKKAVTSKEASSSLVASVLGTVSSPVAAQLPSAESLSRTVRGIRQRNNPLPPNPRKSTLYEIPEHFQQTLKSVKFLLFDSEDINNRLLIFATEDNLQVLRGCDTWYCDGTFKVVPEIFDQLYTVHGEVNGKVVPLVYALCPNRRKRTYQTLLRVLKDAIPGVAPKNVMSDFEMAFLKAVTLEFPECELKGCLFHFGQALWRSIQDHDLAPLYRESSRVARNLRMLFALAFVPFCDVHYAYDALLQSKFFTDNEKDLRGFLDYFEHTWVGVLGRRKVRRGAMFDVSLWNHYSSVMVAVARTNNAVEGWHHALNRRANGSHLVLWKMIELLQAEQGLVEAHIARANAHAPANNRNKRYKDNDARLKSLVAAYNRQDVLQYLKNVAANLSL